jgi:four helix bundle protein
VSIYRFEDLRVWQAAKQQSDRVAALIRRPEFRNDLPLSDQINRASLSVTFNIAEGFLRLRDKETAQFLRYSFASNGELKAGYYIADAGIPASRRNRRIDRLERKHRKNAAAMAGHAEG